MESSVEFGKIRGAGWGLTNSEFLREPFTPKGFEFFSSSKKLRYSPAMTPHLSCALWALSVAAATASNEFLVPNWVPSKRLRIRNACQSEPVSWNVLDGAGDHTEQWPKSFGGLFIGNILNFETYYGNLSLKAWQRVLLRWPNISRQPWLISWRYDLDWFDLVLFWVTSRWPKSSLWYGVLFEKNHGLWLVMIKR